VLRSRFVYKVTGDVSTYCFVNSRVFLHFHKTLRVYTVIAKTVRQAGIP